MAVSGLPLEFREAMNITVTRDISTETSVSSTVALDDAAQPAPFCYGLEPALTAPVNAGHPCIPAGAYPLTLRWSLRFNRLMPHVECVPGRAGVLIHWGNYPRDTDGCLLVGAQRGADSVLSSTVAFNRLFALLVAAAGGAAALTALTADPAAAAVTLGVITYVNTFPV